MKTFIFVSISNVLFYVTKFIKFMYILIIYIIIKPYRILDEKFHYVSVKND